MIRQRLLRRCCEIVLLAGIGLVVDGLNRVSVFADDDSRAVVEGLQERWKKVEEQVRSVDCKCRLLWYTSPAFYVEKGGHRVKKSDARKFIQASFDSWIKERNPDLIYGMSEELGVPPVELAQAWAKAQILWEPGKARNLLIPYSETHGTSIDAAFDGIAEWQHVKQSRQVAVYDHSPKTAHFHISSMRHTPTFRGEWGVHEISDTSVTLIGSPSRGGLHVKFDRDSNLVVFSGETDGGTLDLDEYYAAGIEAIDPAQPMVKFPRCSANVWYDKGELAKAEIFFIEECVFNRELVHDDYAISAPAGTNVFYAGDMLPGEAGAKHDSLITMRLGEDMKDVRVLLPELRRHSEMKNSPKKQVAARKSVLDRTFLVVVVNGIGILVIALLALARAKRRRDSNVTQ